jgi:hypothetical protein
MCGMPCRENYKFKLLDAEMPVPMKTGTRRGRKLVELPTSLAIRNLFIPYLPYLIPATQRVHGSLALHFPTL